MNVSKLIWVGSCVGGLLSCSSSTKVLPAGDSAAPSPNATVQESTYTASQATSLDDIQKFREVLFASRGETQPQQGSSHPDQSFHTNATNPEAEQEKSSQSLVSRRPSSSSSFFSVLPTYKKSPDSEELAQPGSTLPLATLDDVEEAIAPVARLSRQTVAQVQLDSVVSVLPRRPESVDRFTPSNTQDQVYPPGVLLPSLQSGMFEQCSQMIWRESNGMEEANGSASQASTTSVSDSESSFSLNHFITDERDHGVFVNSQLVAEFPSQQEAEQFAESIRNWLADEAFDPDSIQPRLVAGEVAITGATDTVLLKIEDELTQYTQTVPVAVAIAWSNTLRTAFGSAPLDLADAQISLQELEVTGRKLQGTASWYGPYFHGRITASGEPFNQEAMTAAHPSLPFGTYLKVTNQENGRSAVVQINDRGPYIGERSLDLSRQAAECLGSEITGVVPYDAVILEMPQQAEHAPKSLMTLISRS